MSTATKPKPPANYFGGKFGTIGQEIVKLIPEHKYYIEPFGGMAGVLFLKAPSLVEIYNDIDSRIVNLFKVLRDDKKSKQLIKKLKNTPFSREEYNECGKLFYNKQEKPDGVEQARMVIVMLLMGIQPSLRYNGFRKSGLKYETSVARQFRNRVEQLEFTIDRLRNVVIECLPAIKLITKYNNENCFIYLDPPYVHSTRFGSKDYGHEMDDIDHEILLTLCNQSKSKILISGYDSELYNQQLKNWHRIEIKVVSPIAASNGKNDANRTEVLWANYKINRNLSLFE